MMCFKSTIHCGIRSTIFYFLWALFFLSQSGGAFGFEHDFGRIVFRSFDVYNGIHISFFRLPQTQESIVVLEGAERKKGKIIRKFDADVSFGWIEYHAVFLVRFEPKNQESHILKCNFQIEDCNLYTSFDGKIVYPYRLVNRILFFASNQKTNMNGISYTEFRPYLYDSYKRTTENISSNKFSLFGPVIKYGDMVVISGKQTLEDIDNIYSNNTSYIFRYRIDENESIIKQYKKPIKVRNEVTGDLLYFEEHVDGRIMYYGSFNQGIYITQTCFKIDLNDCGDDNINSTYPIISDDSIVIGRFGKTGFIERFEVIELMGD